MSRRFIPYGRQSIDEDDISAVAEVLRGDWLTTGPKVEAFEQAFADTVGARYAVACSSGTAALHLAALALGVEAGDRVVVPTITFLASASAPHIAGAEIEFADVDPSTALLTPEMLEAALERAGGPVKAVVAVHMNGQACDLEGLAKVAEAHGAVLIEDACHAVGTTYATSDGATFRVGGARHSAMACFSFHPVKTIAMGEGGAVTTNDPVLRDRLRLFRSHGMEREPQRFRQKELGFGPDGAANPWYYEMHQPGYNYRASDINCALGLSQLRKLDRLIEGRAAITAAYDERFAAFPQTLRPIDRVAGGDAVWHLYVLLIEFEQLSNKDRGQVMRELAERGIGTQVHYIPVHAQPYYAERYGARELPGAAAYYRRALSIPLFPDMTVDDVDLVVDSLRDVFGLRLSNNERRHG